MGGVVFGPGTLADGLHETIGYKSGLAVSIPELCGELNTLTPFSGMKKTLSGCGRKRFKTFTITRCTKSATARSVSTATILGPSCTGSTRSIAGN